MVDQKNNTYPFMHSNHHHQYHWAPELTSNRILINNTSSSTQITLTVSSEIVTQYQAQFWP